PPDLQERAASVALERNQIHIQFDGSATGQLLGQRKAEALRFGWVGCFEFGIRKDTEAADLLLVPILLGLHDSLDSTIAWRSKGHHPDADARGLLAPRPGGPRRA